MENPPRNGWFRGTPMYGNPMKPRNIIYLKYTRPGKHPQNYGKIMKDPPLKQWVNPCKSTISTGPFSIAMWKKPEGKSDYWSHTAWLLLQWKIAHLWDSYFFGIIAGGDHINIVKRKQLSNQPTNQSLLVTRSQVGRASASSLSPGPYHLGVKEDPSPHRASDQSQNQPCQQ